MVRPVRGPAMTDVAKLAGVSRQTVSRVLNDHPNVREQTRMRVQAAISELGCRPNRAARLIATGTYRERPAELVTVDQEAGAYAATRHLREADPVALKPAIGDPCSYACSYARKAGLPSRRRS